MCSPSRAARSTRVCASVPALLLAPLSASRRPPRPAESHFGRFPLSRIPLRPSPTSAESRFGEHARLHAEEFARTANSDRALCALRFGVFSAAIGLGSTGEACSVNFGAKPFMFDLLSFFVSLSPLRSSLSTGGSPSPFPSPSPSLSPPLPYSPPLGILPCGCLGENARLCLWLLSPRRL